MSKLAKDIIAGMKDAIAFAKGDTSRGVLTTYIVPVVDVKTIRKKTGLSKEDFCQLFAIKPNTLQAWEENKKRPGTSARVFLTLIDEHPATAKKTLKMMGYTVATAAPRKKAPTTKPKTVQSPTKGRVIPKILKTSSRKKRSAAP